MPTVLIIDDDLVSREVMATILTMTGYTVDTAPGGAQALELLDTEACVPDVILMDAQMPGLSGSELVVELRARSRAALYAISGSDVPADVVKGTDGFLMKPLGPETLQKVLEQHATDHPAEAAPDAPVVNLDTLAQFRKLMTEKSVRQIFVAVAADLEKRQSALRTALLRGDSAEVKRIGHSIKGGCGMAGALEAARLGALLEARGDDLEYSRTLLPQFDAAVDNLKRMLDKEFSPQSAESSASS